MHSGGGGGGASPAPKVHGAKRAEESFSSGYTGVAVEMSGLGVGAQSPRHLVTIPPGGGGVGNGPMQVAVLWMVA